MKILNYAEIPQGFGLPKQSQNDTFPIVDGLDTHQRGWRIRHPKAVTSQRDNLNLFPHHWQPASDLSIFGGMGREPKKTPPLCRSFVWHCLEATRSAFVPKTQRNIPMIYTFLIAANRGRIADFQRIRTISAFAHSETEARKYLSGLSLVFLSRFPTKGAHNEN